MFFNSLIATFQNLPFDNLDLLSVGVTTAAIALLGAVIYLNNRKSITNQTFLAFSVVTIFWSVLNYINYQTRSLYFVLWLLRLVIFFGVLQAYTAFQFFYVFPADTKDFPKKYKYILVPVVVFTAIFTLTPAVFPSINQIAETGVSKTVVGPGIAVFIGVVIFLIFGGIVILIKKTIQAKSQERTQFLLVLIGTIIMFTLLIIFNLVLPAVFLNVRFIPLGALFIFPFIAFTAYAIYRHRLFHIKDLVTLSVAFALTIVSFAEIIFADTLPLIIFRVSVFILVLIFSIRMIRDMFSLEFANDRLKELDQMKSEFVSLATHQIRAPLTAIKGYISLIQEGDYGEVTPEISKGLAVVMDSTNNLVTIVGDFLDVSRIEQGRMKFDFSDFNLEKLTEEVAQEYRPNIEKRGLLLDYTFDQQEKYDVHADRGKVKQVIGNILDNSIKYTPAGKVNINVKNQAGKILITIADTGVGINPKTLPKLFQKFTRADNANETNILGTGLGLYVAKNMIESMGGRVWAESEGEGKGSQFYIELGGKV